MKKLILLVVILSAGFANAQAFKGKGDVKAQLGANLQKGANGLFVSADYGVGENMSIGISSTYILGVSDGNIGDVEFKDKFDAKLRFNANIGNVLNISDKLDVYPGLDLGVKNLGLHLGGRYFFTNGFGIFVEFGTPIAKYDRNASDANNQFMTNFGLSFNL